jgi:outer membrane receptor protein involved in Fe transport
MPNSRNAAIIAATLLATCARAQQAPKPPAPVQQTVTVTADRSGINDSATSVTVFSQLQLQQVPALALDDRLHSDAGFQLFRRTSSWTANPTSQGLSLRGLGSTAASRTLVVSDQVPLSDPFGGWVHWDEVPALAIDRVELLHGGSSDLYGSSAIGGVVEIVPANAYGFLGPKLLSGIPFEHPEGPTGTALQIQADAAGATEDSGMEDGLVVVGNTKLQGLGAMSFLSTDGYIPTAPAFRGTVDVPSNVTAESARAELYSFFHPGSLFNGSAFLRGNVLNEARSNGTPDQTNGTRLWRYTAGADADLDQWHFLLRGFGSRETYRQSFSSIAGSRNTETLTKLQHVPLDEFGVVAQVQSRHILRNLTAALGLDLRDIRATDDETVVASSVTTATTARQREIGGYADTIWQPKNWSISGSIRVDSFRTFDAQQVLSSSPKLTPQPTLAELFAGPRVGLVRTLPHGLALTGTAFRAFRGPTMNELYRTGQVGQQTTLANNTLLAERATGFEFGGELQRGFGHLRATYFWTEVNRPISAVLLSQTATTQTLQRQNLGQIRSRGLMLEARTNPWHRLDASLGYQLAIATVTAFNSSSAAQANLTGNWIPEVPRQAVTSTVNYTRPRVASLHLIASYQGREFDDAANQSILHPYARFDLQAERPIAHSLSVFAGAQNLLNRSIDAGRTPVLTLAAPRLLQAGLRYTFSH